MNNPGQFLPIPQQSASQPQISGLQFQKPRKYFGGQNKGEMKKSSIFFSNPKSTHPEPSGTANTSTFGLEFKKKTQVQGGQQTQGQGKAEGGLLAPQAAGSKPAMWSSQIVKPSCQLKIGGLENLGRFVAGSQEFDQKNRLAQKLALESGSRLGNLDQNQPKASNFAPSNYSYPSIDVIMAASNSSSKYVADTTSKPNYTPNFSPNYTPSYTPSPTYDSYSSTSSGSSYGNYPMPSLGNYTSPTDYKPHYPTTDYSTPSYNSSSTSSYGTSGTSSSSSYTPPSSSYTATTPSYPSYNTPSSSSSYTTPSYSSYNDPLKDISYTPTYDYTKPVDTYKPTTTEYNPTEYKPVETSYPAGGFSKNKDKPTNQPASSTTTNTGKKQPQIASKWKKQDFQIGKKLGKGAFGDVFVARHKPSGFICALKIITKARIHEQKVQLALLRQLKIQFYLHHKNIAALYGFFQDADTVYLLIQLCTGGQLFDMLKKQRRLNEPLTADIIRQVCLGIDVIHRERIIHRDIKPENIIMHEGVAKICDFGWSVFRGEGLRTTFCGTPMYTSPAMLKGEEYDQCVDIWAIGVLTYQLLIGKIPFKILCQDDLDRILTDQIKFPDYVDVTQSAKDFILKILNRNKYPKLQVEDLLNHKFLQLPKKQPSEFDALML